MPIMEDIEDNVFWASCDTCRRGFRASSHMALLTRADRPGLILELRYDDWEVTSTGGVYCPQHATTPTRQPQAA
jgi:hypothetical protein